MTNDAQDYHIAEIRKLLMEAFMPEDLRRFCQDRPFLSSVVAKFGPGHGLDDMVDEVLDYCRTQLLWDELLAEVRRVNARQYAHHGPYLIEGIEGRHRALRPHEGRRLFPGLHSYGIEDRDIFFGRAREVSALAAKIERDPVVVVNGLSGCGKSSLIKAGVIPLLQESGYQVVYTPVFEHITNDILHEVGRLLDVDEVPQDYVDALQELHLRGRERDVVLFVDQFEEALGPTHSPEALETFLRGIPRLLRQMHRFATLVLVLRADWLYFLATSVRRFYPRLNVYSIIFTLDPLTEETAREAIIKPLQAEGVTFDKTVIEEIIHSLLRTSVRPSIGPYLQPIHLQIVLRTLSDAAEDAGVPQLAFTEECYRQSGGVESILRNYLSDSLANRPEAWRLLARFVGSDDRTAQTIRHSELLAVPTAGDVQSELEFLVYQGFVEAHEAGKVGDAYYRLAHDSLVDVIVNFLSRNPDQHGWRLAEDWLASGVGEWQESTTHENRDGLLLEKHRYLQVYQYRDRLKITGEAKGLLLLTALRYGHTGFGYWLSRDPRLAGDIRIVVDKLLSSDLVTQTAARMALAGCVQPTDDSTMSLGEPEKQSIHDELKRAMISSAGSANRDAAAQALWTLGVFDTAGEQLLVGAAIFRHWIRKHWVQMASYILTALAILAIIGGILLARERLRGSWQVFGTLKAGGVPLVVVDPQDPETTYAITVRGSGPREGISLFMQKGDTWETIRSDLFKGTPTSLVIVHTDKGSRFYVSGTGTGIMRSDEGASMWELANRGLPSRAITSLVIDPDNPNTLYAGTHDWRGILTSSDGGDSWGFYDYVGEIYGAIINELAYTRANGGSLIAGTEDGRILVHPRGSNGWELRHSLAKGAIKALVVGGTDGSHLYAGTSRGIVLGSQDGGEHWQVAGQPSNQFNIGAIAVAPDDPQLVYLSSFGNGGYTVWKSEDGGQSWDMLPCIGLPRSRIASLQVTGRREQRLVAGTNEGLFVSRDGGRLWEKEALGAPLARVQKVALSKMHSAPVYAVVDGSIFVNPEGDLVTWVHGKGLRAETVRTIIVDPDDPLIAYAGVLLLGEWSVFATVDGGYTWEQTSSPSLKPVVPDTTALALAKTQDGQSVLYAGTAGCGIIRSMDGGRSWDTFGRARCEEYGRGNMPSGVSFMAIDASSPDVVYAAEGQLFFRSVNGGHSWRQWELATISPIMNMVADPVKPHTVYLVTGSDGFWYSDDGGETWDKPENQPFGGAELTAMATFPSKPSYLVVGASNGGVWMTSNGGKTWVFIRENLSVNFISSIATSKALKGNVLVSSLSEGIALYTPGELVGDGR